MTLEAQYMTLLVMSINGVVLGAVYDMYRVVLRHWKFLRWAGPIFDFAFWILGIFLVFWSLMWANHGDLRIYVFIVLLIGYAIYRIFFRRIVVGSTIGIIMGIGYICLTLYRAFLLLVIAPLQKMWLALLALLRALDRLLRVFERAILWPFKPLKTILFWLARFLLALVKVTARPFVKPLLPYILPVVNRLKTKAAPFVRRGRAMLKKGKGFWSRLTNWLLNRDDNKPKP
ncbi:spore cortex biosynthesis protein YabQ [Effusibacillus consociatus]|uniref:Spore cortex biosynthesis protein YabQ n=1 Tax=Effusibacillus consociatus TaxID=1117041 RepID=A0ABV9Q200_9BACL